MPRDLSIANFRVAHARVVPNKIIPSKNLPNGCSPRVTFAGLEQSVAGNYTCSANNLFGDDSVTYTLIVVMPPRAPKLELQYTTTHSIRLRWNHPDNGGATIQGGFTDIIRK